jgi:hypothetical protein
MSARMTPDEIRQQAISVMKSGGREVCERAITKWLRGDYGDDYGMINAYVANWQDTAREISRLTSSSAGPQIKSKKVTRR